MEDEIRNLHLKLPVDVMETLRPTGCRKSKESEAVWRLTAALDVAREMKPSGTLPVFKPDSPVEKPCTREMNIPLRQADLDFLTQTANEEGGSRGKLAREFLMTAKVAIDSCSGSLTFEGLVDAIRKIFID